MDITLDKKNSTEASIKITLKEADYQPKVEEKVKEYSKKANIKGFRPGKVPPTLVRKMYGKSILVDEINHMLSHSITDYIKENKLQILGEPLPDQNESKNIDWENQKEFEFEYNIGLVDEFDYDLTKVKVIRYKIEMDDKSLAETIDNLKQQYGKMTNPEVSQEGDYLYGELQQADGEFTATFSLPLNEVEEKERKNFIGRKKEDRIAFDIREAFKDDETIAHVTGKEKDEIAGLEGKFEFTVLNVNRQEAADLNQEFFDKIFGKDTVTSEEEFKSKVKETISENYDRETDAYLNKSIQDIFIESTEIQLPDEFLKRWLLLSNEGKISMEDIEKEYDAYANETKWNLLQNKIAEDNEVKVENTDVVERTKSLIRQQLASSGMGSQLEDNMDAFADNYLKSENGQNYMKIFNQVKTEKLLDFIKEKITIDTKEVNVEEFKKIVSN